MDGFFHPGSVAVIGASSNPAKVGGMIVRNLLDSGFAGAVYPVNVRGGKIQGLDAYASVEEIGRPVDLAVICVKAPLAPAEMEKVGRAGCRRAIVITAGFREEGTAGRELEEALGEAARRWGVRVIGPNCFGVMDTGAHLNTTFSSLYPKAGNIALTSQSGAVGATMLDWSLKHGAGISRFASLGNKMDVGEPELLDSLLDDSSTKVVGMYCESISDGPGFIRAAGAYRGRKPLVMLKAGRTSAGSKAASSHTGALAGADSVYDALFRKLGIIRVYDLDSFFDTLSAFSLCGPMERDGIAVITNAGGLGVMAADACSESAHVMVAELSRATMEEVRRQVPTVASASNPIDVRGDSESASFERAMRIVSADPSVGAIAVLSSPLDTADLDAVAESVLRVRGEISMPIAVCFAGGKVCESARAALSAGGVPTFPDPERAVAALDRLRRYAVTSSRPETPMRMPEADGRPVAEAVVRRALGEGRVSLSEEEGKRILSAYGVPVPGERVAATACEAVEAARAIGYPVVMKVVSPDIHHKTDVGGVVVGVDGDDAVRLAYENIVSRCRGAVPGAAIGGVAVQKMATGQEVILSFIRDEQFGPVMSFGLGGIYVEIIGEISRELLPMSERCLDRLVESTKAYRMLSGARGKPPADLDSLRDVIRRVARIAAENEEIYELEINPVMVGPKGEGSWAVDALTTLRWSR